VFGKRGVTPRRVPTVVVALGAAGLLTASAPALAYKGWSHFGASPARCAVGCHAGLAPTNATCTSCHTGGFATTGGKYCWSCHYPGQETLGWSATSTGCSATCHLFSGDDSASYGISFTHGTKPHLGADYAACLGCHAVSGSGTDPGGSPHHDAVAGHAPACTDCHDGTTASRKVNHDGLTSCTSCHSGMDTPAVPAVCSSCHSAARFGTGSCTSSSCHGTQVIHTATPGLGKSCTDCHNAHYTRLGTCTTCHEDVAAYHHLGKHAISLGQCTSCHDGSIASAKVTHVGFGQCVLCHQGMDRPAQPAACELCHRTQGTSAACTSCHSTRGMFGKEQVHTLTPAGKTCSDCHRPHFTDVAVCETCHAGSGRVHHGSVTVTPSRLSLSPAVTTIVYGASIQLSGILTSGGAPLAGVEVKVEAMAAGSSAGRVTTGVEGEFAVSLSPSATTTYQLWCRGSATATAVLGPALATATVRVCPIVTLELSNATSVAARYFRYPLGRAVVVRGDVRPGHALLGDGSTKGSVTLSAYKHTDSRSLRHWRWVKAKTVARGLNAAGRYRQSWRPPSRGAFRIVASFAADVDHLAARSVYGYVRIY
jgi:hypothetical protein